jgi:hypothetical protein
MSRPPWPSTSRSKSVPGYFPGSRVLAGLPAALTTATSRSAVGHADNSGVGRKQLLKQATTRLSLGLSVRLVAGRPQMPARVVTFIGQSFPRHNCVVTTRIPVDPLN